MVLQHLYRSRRHILHPAIAKCCGIADNDTPLPVSVISTGAAVTAAPIAKSHAAYSDVALLSDLKLLSHWSDVSAAATAADTCATSFEASA